MNYYGVSGSSPGIPFPYPKGLPEQENCYYNDGIYYNDSAIRVRDITDGASNTAIVCEVWGRNEHSDPPDGRGINLNAVAYLDASPNTDRGTQWRPNSFHTGGVHIGFADGSVRFVGNSTSVEIIKSIASRSRGEIVGEF